MPDLAITALRRGAYVSRRMAVTSWKLADALDSLNVHVKRWLYTIALVCLALLFLPFLERKPK